MKTGSVLLVCLTILCLPAVSNAAERPVLVVMGIHDESGSLDEDLLNSLTEYLAASVAECGTYRIVPPWDVQPALLRKKLDAGKECFDPECQLKLAAQLNANLYVSTSITRTADTCTVISALDDVKQQTQLIAARAHGDCNEPGLVGAIEDVAYFFILWGGCRPSARGELEVSEDVYQQAAEAGVQQPLMIKDRMHLPDVEEINGEQVGSVTDVMVGTGWTIHTGVGHGIRFDGRLFLNSFVDIPVLKDLGFGVLYSTYTGYGRTIDIPDDLRAGATSQWQVEMLYRLAFNRVLTMPALVFHFGYGGSGCLHDPGMRFLTGAEYRYPYLGLEAYFMPYEPHIRMWLASSVLFNVASSEEHAEGTYLGLKVGIGVDLLPTEYIYLGMGYELSRYYDDDWSSDLFVSFFLRAGCYYN
jgi:hypothetical protein